MSTDTLAENTPKPTQSPASDAAITPANEAPVVEAASQESGPNPSAAHENGKDAESVPVSPSTTAATPVGISGAVKIAVSALKPHPLNETIYGTEVDLEFIQAVERNGIFHPLLVTHDHLIISGNRRYAAAVKLGISEVAVVYFESDDPLDIQTALVEANRQREKSNEQIGREFNLLVDVESQRSALRMATNKTGRGVKAVAPAEKGKTRDLVANRIGPISGVSAERAGKVVEVIDKLVKKKHTKKADDIREALRNNIAKALKLAEELGELPAPATKKTKGSKAPSASAKPNVAQATPAPAIAQEDTSQPIPIPTPLEVTPSPRSAGEASDQTDGTHYKALEAADAAVTFLRSRESTKLTKGQKDDWKKIGDQIATLLMKLGIKISAA